MKEAQEQLLRSFSAAVEQTVEQIGGAEENYFGILQRTMALFPWSEAPNKKLQSGVDQDIGVASVFAHRLSRAKDFQELARIESEFVQMCCNVLVIKKRFRRRTPRLRRIRSKSAPLDSGSLP
jgi:hypothetical protein